MKGEEMGDISRRIWNLTHVELEECVNFDLSEEVAALESRIAELRIENEQLQSDLERCSECKDELEKECDDTADKLSLLEQAIENSDPQREISDLEAENIELKEQISRLLKAENSK